MKNLIRIARIALTLKKQLFFNLMFNVLGMFFSIFSFAMIIPLLRVIFNSDESFFRNTIAEYQGNVTLNQDSILDFFNYKLAVFSLANGKESTLIYICIFLVSMVFLKNLFTYLSNFYLTNIVHLSVKDIRDNMYQKIIRLPMSFFSDEKKGDLLSRFSADVKEVEISIKATTNAIFKEPFYIIGYLITLTLISIKLTLFILIFLPVAGFVISKISNGLKKRTNQGQIDVGKMMSITEETLYGLRIVKGFNAQSQMIDKYKESNNRLFKVMVGISRRVYIASPVSEFLGVIATAGVLLYGGNLVFAGEIYPDIFIGYLILFSQLITPFKAISKAMYDSSQGISALNRVEEVLFEEETIKSDSKCLNINSFSKEICYSNVGFKYEKDWVLKDINITIKKGQTAALVGHSGSGKTTLADLLIRFYDVQEGEILIDGKNIKNVDLNQLRSLMGVVTQESVLFNDTIFNNIAFGLKKVSKEEVVNASKMANAHGFISKLDNGYETVIGDAGNKLSGGQKQRISIARALLKNPNILILDEATSSLDTASEKAVQEALDHLMKNRTSLVIAHRLSTIQHADIIFVVDNGKIVESGSHEELLIKNNFYKKFIDMQAI
ncbi:MAG: antibiotic ABC transporter ATP-binding protein [Crocinitomicaceae bacterium]|nr:antibiotic ABC transporter ATP-binding protein [Crocinitomicaceae bacterium]|tara:strand:+ start:8327 stop:10156 length:1830 start_codon:yes stop_codon:yes gene_type:complete